MDYDEIINFISDLTPDENEAVKRFALANKGSKLTIDDYRQAVNIFRSSKVSKAKDNRTMEQKLNDAGADFELQGKILSQYGANPLDKGAKFIKERDLYPGEILPNELQSSEGIGGYTRQTWYKAEDTDRFNNELDEMQKNNQGAVARALAEEDKFSGKFRNAKRVFEVEPIKQHKIL